MRSYIGSVVVALTVVGCVTEELDTSEASQAIGKGLGTCPDPSDCTLNNGGGVYTEELGNIGMGANNYMIGRFVNLGAGLQVQGRGYNPNTGNYFAHTAELVHAIYNGQTYSVVSITEWLTLVTVTLRKSSTSTLVLTGPQIVNLSLVFKVDDGDSTLTFTESLPDEHGFNGADLNPVKEFHAVWNKGLAYNASTAQEYCTRAPVDDHHAGKMDPVVFQQGIDVNPITAVMVQNNAYVTLSCRHGSLASARLWGYSYRNAATADLFEAAMHMKRASYCGDDTFYTLPNTKIDVRDSTHLMDDPLDYQTFEASWGRVPGGPIRALCVNKDHLRRPGTVFPPPEDGPGGVPFNGDCLSPVTGQVLFHIDECPTTADQYPPVQDPGAFHLIADALAN